MADRPKIFLAYSFPEKKWMDRVQAALTAEDPALQIIAWDERKLKAGKIWERELPELLRSCRVAVMLVSDLFVGSDFIRRAKLPALFEAARRDGVAVCWVLVSHCLYEGTGLEEADAINNLDWPLDGVSTAKREAILAAIAQKLSVLAAGRPLPVEPDPITGTESFDSPDCARLGHIIEARRRTAAVLRRFAGWLLPFVLALIAFSLAAGIAREDLSLLLFIAGFALFVAAMRQVVKARLDFISQSIVTVRCVKTGLADTTLPERQRGDLLRKARQMLGET